MSRQALINEIERLYVEAGEKKKDLLDELYVFNKYPALAQLFETSRSPGEKWAQLVREVVFFDKADLRYMYNRVMLLVRRFGQQRGSYFTVNRTTGTYLLPDRLSDLNRLSELYMQFFYEIYPRISRRFNFEVFNQEQESNALRGKVNWDGTMIHSIKTGLAKNPIQFTTLLPRSDFETPENLLLVAAILRLQHDAARIQNYPFKEALTLEERTTLGRIGEGCRKLLNNSIIQELVPPASKYLRSGTETGPIGLESEVALRIQDEGRRLAPYSRLLDWSIRYRQMNLRSLAPNRTDFPIDRRENLDTMFELWVLFEYLYYLTELRGAHVLASPDGNRFRIEMDGFNLTLFYEKWYNGWAIGARPDFTIEAQNKRPVIMDAKNWQESKDDAIYKMLGYLNNLDAGLGILFFPNATAVPERRTIRPAGLEKHLEQSFLNAVVPPTETDEAIRTKLSAFEEVTNLVMESLSATAAVGSQ